MTISRPPDKSVSSSIGLRLQQLGEPPLAQLEVLPLDAASLTARAGVCAGDVVVSVGTTIIRGYPLAAVTSMVKRGGRSVQIGFARLAPSLRRTKGLAAEAQTYSSNLNHDEVYAKRGSGT